MNELTVVGGMSYTQEASQQLLSKYRKFQLHSPAMTLFPVHGY